MNILVLVKQVPDLEALISVKPDGRGLDIENKNTMNLFDAFAVEEAVRIKERLKTGTVTAMTLGTQRAVEVLRSAIAMGADRAVLLSDPAFEGSDSFATAKILARAAKSEPFDMILCGRQASDDDAAQVGSLVAEFLGVPHVTTIVKLDCFPEKKLAVVERQIEGGRETIECPLPALFTCQKGLNEPRVPLVAGVMKAMRVKVEQKNLAALGMSPDEVGAKGSKTKVVSWHAPGKRPPVKMVEGATPAEAVKALVKALHEESKVI